MTGPHKNRTPGRYVAGPEGLRAFVPAPLPPSFQWTPSLVRALSDADRAVGELAGEGRRLPNLHLLIRPFLRREAVLSSRIEGTQATLGELLAAEAGASVDRSPADLKEVVNYVVALKYGIERLATLPLSLRLLREVHGHLMAGVRGGQATPGEFRRIQNWIGPPGCSPVNATYVPPSPGEMIEALTELERFLHDASLPPLVHAALIHYQFEAIHPFLDGNGRVGRLLIILFLLERKVLPSPLLYLSAFFEATRRDYYALLRGITEAGEWEAWIEYFLNGVSRQTEDVLSRASRINSLLDQWRLAVAGASPTAPELVALLGENPYWTIPGISTRLGVAYTTAQRAAKRLVDVAVLTPLTDAKRNRVYCAQAILEILEEPARLVPEETTG
ncbi:MAG: Fic family protein [Acidobacteria bacterium]|nr:Fic family protein [Acidobacteriota bacterium]